MDPFKQLASILDMRMANHAGRALSGLPCELGIITASGLKLDSFKHEIQDYLVADWLADLHLPECTLTGTPAGLRDSYGGAVSGTATFSFEAVVVPNVRMQIRLNPGDRVLAIPVNGGQDAVVISKAVVSNT